MTGCPIRRSWGQGSFAPNPGLSQLITSFFASESQGIHRLHLTFSLMSYMPTHQDIATLMSEYTCYSLLLIVYLTSWFSICNRFVSVCQRSLLLPLNAERHAMLIQISKYDSGIEPKNSEEVFWFTLTFADATVEVNRTDL